MCLALCLTFFVISNSLVLGGGYVYPQPQPPVYQDVTDPPLSYLPPNLPPILDEVPDIGSTYLPSNPLYPPLGTPALDIQPPLFDTPSITDTDDSVVVEIPPAQYLPPTNQYLPPNRQQLTEITPSLKVSNLSCVDSTDEYSRFYAQFSAVQPFKMSPSMEGRSSPDCLNVISDNVFRINLEGIRVRQCGVKRCVNSSTKQRRMCANLRMATVRGIRLPEDVTISIQCIPQPTIISHTKEIRFRPQTNRQRSIARNVAVASGGSQRKLDMRLNLLRKSQNSAEFNEIVQPDTPVSIGEELLLKASVKDESGWHYVRMDSVVMKSATTQQSATLIDDNGCTVPSMRNVCPDQPRQINPLMVVLPFRAFLFQGNQDTEEMVLSLRMIGCLNTKDCLQINRCNDHVAIGDKKRSTRSTKVNDEIEDVELRFKVQSLQQNNNSSKISNGTNKNYFH
ncbi:hypothetical protein HHI36_005732 [Cryptolaemus montrouzieri]|uniref:ZP domain-containing protein n=1 Tax=Cryptolaemus montrouzieri TaxID=559131 RepID=A0ABD2NVU1_9CUCU